MKILFCQLRNHGDIIRTFPLMDAIKSFHPEWEIGYTCFPEMMDTCRLCNSIDDIIPQNIELQHFSRVNRYCEKRKI